MTDTRLDGRIVLVTGGAAGIGAAICRAFAAEGARIVVQHLQAEKAAPADRTWEHITADPSVARKLAAEIGGVSVATDLAVGTAAKMLFDEVEHVLGPVLVLVNNAAHGESPDTFVHLTAESLERHYRVHAIALACSSPSSHGVARRLRSRSRLDRLGARVRGPDRLRLVERPHWRPSPALPRSTLAAAGYG